MPYCPECGEEVQEKTKFCPECGARISKAERSKEKTELGLEENVEGALAYLLGFISGIILYFIEEKNDFIRFHAFQSTVIFIGLLIVGTIFGFIPILGTIISIVIGLVAFIVWIVGMIKAYKGELYKFPVVGDMAEEHIKK